jgi:hypothetical protein
MAAVEIHDRVSCAAARGVSTMSEYRKNAFARVDHEGKRSRLFRVGLMTLCALQ